MDIIFSAFIAVSLDGYTARPNGKLDWLDNAAEKNSKEDYGYQQYIDSIDCIVLGRKTFEKAVSFPTWPYERKRVIVLSQSLKKIPVEYEDKALLFNGDVQQLAVELQSYRFKHIYVDGGTTIQSFTRAELLDDIVLTQVPVLLGKGIPLFGEVAKDVKLKLIKSQSYSSGFVQSKYKIERYSSRYFD